MAGLTGILFLTPTWRPAGGVVKILDYVTHARAAGLAARIWSPTPPEDDEPVFRIDRFHGLLDDPEITTVTGSRLGLGAEELAFISWPTDVERILPRLPAGASTERVIHIIQNVRHANPRWEDGYPLRLLHRRLARIWTNGLVADACAPFVHRDAFAATIPLGHPLGWFLRESPRDRLSSPVRIAYTTWKSTVGDRVAERLADDPRFEFRAIRESVGWSELRDLYHWCDVFLGCPNPEEGFYMPGMEAMEAGAIVVMPDAGGNRAYGRFGVNCLQVDHEDEQSYVGALHDLVARTPDELAAMRAAAMVDIGQFDLARERALFGDYLVELAARLGLALPGRSAGAPVPEPAVSSQPEALAPAVEEAMAPVRPTAR